MSKKTSFWHRIIVLEILALTSSSQIWPFEKVLKHFLSNWWSNSSCSSFKKVIKIFTKYFNCKKPLGGFGILSVNFVISFSVEKRGLYVWIECRNLGSCVFCYSTAEMVEAWLTAAPETPNFNVQIETKTRWSALELQFVRILPTKS